MGENGIPHILAQKQGKHRKIYNILWRVQVRPAKPVAGFRTSSTYHWTTMQRARQPNRLMEPEERKYIVPQERELRELTPSPDCHVEARNQRNWLLVGDDQGKGDHQGQRQPKEPQHPTVQPQEQEILLPALKGKDETEDMLILKMTTLMKLLAFNFTNVSKDNSQ